MWRREGKRWRPKDPVFVTWGSNRTMAAESARVSRTFQWCVNMTNLCGGLTACWGWDTTPLSRSHPGRCPVSGQVSPPCLPPNCPGYTSDPPLLRVNSGIHLPCCLLNPIGIWVEFWVYRWIWGYTTCLIIHYLFIPEHTYSDLHYNVFCKDLTRFCLDVFSGNTQWGFFGVFVLFCFCYREWDLPPIGQITGGHKHYHVCLLLLLGQRSWTVVRSDDVSVRRPGFLHKPPSQFCCFHSVKPISPSHLAVSSRATNTIRTESRTTGLLTWFLSWMVRLLNTPH